MLLYLVKHTRPDLASSVRELAKRIINPTKREMKELLRVIKFTLETETVLLKIFPKKGQKERGGS